MMAYVVSNAVAFDSFGSLFGFYLTLADIAAKSTVAPLNPLKFRFADRPDSAKLNKKLRTQSLNYRHSEFWLSCLSP